MFIKVTSSGGRRYAQLVESYRNDAGQPRQRTLATLGRLEPGGDVDRLIEALSRAQGRRDAPAGSARITARNFSISSSMEPLISVYLYSFQRSISAAGRMKAAPIPAITP